MRVAPERGAAQGVGISRWRIVLDIRLWDAVSSYRICEVTGLDRSTVRRALHGLEDLGVIDIQPGGTERKGRPELSVIGFGPGALDPRYGGLLRPRTGGHIAPRPGVPEPPARMSKTSRAGPEARPRRLGPPGLAPARQGLSKHGTCRVGGN